MRVSGDSFFKDRLNEPREVISLAILATPNLFLP
jgi:hypothetical protein